MNAKEAIKAAANLGRTVIKAYIGDLTDAELMQRPGPGCNHIAWQLGHLIASEAQLVNMIVPGAGPELPAGFAEQHSKDQANNNEASKFGTKQQYLDLFDKLHAATFAALDGYPDANLDLPAPERMQGICPTMGAMWSLIATHTMMHAGQFVPIRRALGKPVVI